jgi:hypothetical protein
MSEKLKVVSLKLTCNACPSQWEGNLDDGRMIYVRYRWGGLNIRLSYLPSTDIMDVLEGKSIFSETIGEGLDGFLEYDKLVEVTKEVIEWPPKETL